MTRQRFEGLRLELCRRINEEERKAGRKTVNQRVLKNCRPDFSKVSSYQNAWDSLKPARDLVGM